MKTTINKPISKPQNGEYSSIEELVQDKLKKATQTLKNVDLSKLMRPA
jgi:hypothetical protein